MKTTHTALLTIAALASVLFVGSASAWPGPGAGERGRYGVQPGNLTASRAATPQDRAQQRFDAADTNHDHALTREEAAQGMPGMAQRFETLDTDHDGKVSSVEFQSMRNMLRGQMRGANRGTQTPCSPNCPVQRR